MDKKIIQQLYCFRIYRNKFIAHLDIPKDNIYGWDKNGRLKFQNSGTARHSILRSMSHTIDYEEDSHYREKVDKNLGIEEEKKLEAFKKTYPEYVSNTPGETITNLFYNVPWVFKQDSPEKITRGDLNILAEYFGSVKSMDIIEIDELFHNLMIQIQEKY